MAQHWRGSTRMPEERRSLELAWMAFEGRCRPAKEASCPAKEQEGHGFERIERYAETSA